MPRHIKGTIAERLMGRIIIDPDTECWNWSGCLTAAGYGQLRIDGVTIYTHRLAYEEFVGAIPGELHVLHTCDNPKCINPKHLFIGDALANHADCIMKGRKPSGDTWLESEDVDSIRDRYKGGATQQELADMFGVSQPYICRIVNLERR